MTVNHDAVAALPTAAPANKILLRDLLTVRMPYVLADVDSALNLVALDPDTGAAIVDIMFLGRVFHYDPADLTTAHDGTTCLVSAEGRRYKLASGTDVFAYAVLSNALSTPPASPAAGDAYLVAAAATGAWAAKSGYVAVYTKRGWEFVNFGVGRFIYVEATDSYYHKNAGGTWVSGFGSQTLPAASVPLSAAINFGAFVRVTNQTTTAPPAGPAVGDAYIIGPGATGVWAGNDGKVAICEVAGSFTIYTPTNGWLAYDRALKTSYLFDGASWKPTNGVWIGRASAFSAGGSVSSPGGNSNGYTYSIVTPPNSLQRRSVDIATGLSYAAKKAGALLRFHYTADCRIALGTSGINQNQNPVVLALFRDSEANAIAWKIVGLCVELCFLNIAAMNTCINDVFEITASDTASHVYQVAIMSGGSNVNGLSLDNINLTNRTLSVQEAA
ncbi:DUF2793 domain-containing protein [Bradyrhizobium sp. 153]|uniref:DUF2793 domain-containing protein n=1 Tax=Bradyrhizobium sp. 153 TaxID=2782627 RepID=UPI001FF9E342|nr:DUF2793 domain-containing protein [Bradyrhizobium sp. 153]MCK1669446.1 DUF2793 domain-containing protein [Bradyrhizobium sp. 153]